MTPSAPTQLAYSGADGHLYIYDLLTRVSRQLSWDYNSVCFGAWNLRDPVEGRRFDWPVWSPDGRHLACFVDQGRGQEGSFSVYTFEVDGLKEWELWRWNDSWPKYLSWCPGGRQLLALHQSGETLHLSRLTLDEPAPPELVFQGVPLFYSVSPDGRTLLVHIGGSSRSLSAPTSWMVDLTQPLPNMTLLTDHAGLAGTPVWAPDGRRFLYCDREYEQHLLMGGDLPFTEPRLLHQFRGHAIPQWSPDGNAIGLALAPREPGAPFHSLLRLSPEGEEELLLAEDQIMAFWWLADNKRILYATHGSRSEGITFKLAEGDGHTRTLAHLYPSQPQLFMLHFFHQHPGSHPLLGPHGLLFSGYTSKKDLNDSHTLPRIFLIPTDGSPAPRELAHGTFACWRPL